MANDLLDVRQHFITKSGRYDLATTVSVAHDTDNGADFYINAGMKFLDRKYYHLKTVGRRFDAVASGSWYQTFQNCRSIKEVWANDDDGRWQLTRYDYDTIRRNYPGLVSATDTGKPLYYTPVWIRSPDATDIDDQGAFFNYVKTDDDGSYNGILFVPPTDGDYVIETIGHFYFDKLSSNTDSNFWTTEHLEILLKAAFYVLEGFYRNTEGMKDWLAFLDRDGRELEFDIVEQESNDEYVRE